ncbi:MAG: hypothetical protein IJJ74_01410 [Eubacterium sp.]|nr:hypothetical protein [Eubacterium sp.]
MKKGGYVAKLIIAMYMFIGGVFLALTMIMPILKSEHYYISKGVAIGCFIGGVALVALALMLMILPRKKFAAAGYPLSKGWTITPIIILVIFIGVTYLAISKSTEYPPAPLLNDKQTEDLKAVAKAAGIFDTKWVEGQGIPEINPPANGRTQIRDKSWICLRLADYSEGVADKVEARPIAWSGARIYSITNWAVAKPTAADMEELDMVILCRYGLWKENYGKYSTGAGGYTGTSEYVDIEFIDAKTGEMILNERYGHELPKSATSVPHYTVDDKQLAEHLKTVTNKLK